MQSAELPNLYDDVSPMSKVGCSQATPSVLQDLANALQSALSIHDPSIDRNLLFEPSSPPILNVGIFGLPVELLIAIFLVLRPDFPRKPNNHFPNEAITTFYAERRAFTALRGVCVRWCGVITPMAYEELVLELLPLTTNHIEALTGVLGCAAPHVKSVVLNAPGLLRRAVDHVLLKQAGEVVRHGLQGCSQLRRLEFHGDHRIFSHRGTIETTIQKLVSRVTTLSLDYTSHKDLSHCLVGFGHSLERLRVSNDHPDRVLLANSLDLKLHLPSELPRLQHLELSGIIPGSFHGRPHVVTKLLSRIRDNKTGKVPLQTLVLNSIQGLFVSDIIDILSTHRLGSHLNILRLRLRTYRRSEDASLPVQVLRLCPKLTDFEYTSQVSPELFSHTPPTLHHLSLELDMIHGTLSFTPENLKTFLESKRSPALQTLTIFYHSLGFFWATAFSLKLAVICGELGARLETGPERSIVHL